MSSVHECCDCAALPVDDRPQKPRPAVHGGPRSRRCTTHQRAHDKAVRARRHDARVVKVYGLDPGEYEELLAFQGGTCAIPSCRANGKARKLAVDHDHDTGLPRGILCQPHNFLLLGRFVGDLQDALDYLADPPVSRMRRSRSEVA
jgi:hypothetical protein